MFNQTAMWFHIVMMLVITFTSSKVVMSSFHEPKLVILISSKVVSKLAQHGSGSSSLAHVFITVRICVYKLYVPQLVLRRTESI